MTTIKSNGWFPDLDTAINDRDIKTYATKAQAIYATAGYPWANRVVKVERRFETVWIVGQVQTEETAGVTVETFQAPILRFENDGDRCLPVVTFRRPK